jgi:ribonuclease D
LFNLITSEEDLILLGKELSCRKNIAIDTEFRRTTKDNMKLSLVQINDSEEIYIIDCIALESNEEISKIFEDKNINKIIHSCREDIEALYSWTHKNIHNIFDTQIANAFLGNELSISYQGLVKNNFGVTIKKEETMSNWIKRPLRSSQLDYAAMDVEYLLDIFEEQVLDLSKQGKKDWLFEETSLMAKNALNKISQIPEEEYLIPISSAQQNIILKKMDNVIEINAVNYGINKSFLFSKKNQKDYLRDSFIFGAEEAMDLRGAWRKHLLYEDLKHLFIQ